MFVDTHCHLDFPCYKDILSEVIARAHAVGIGRMLTVSTRVARFDDLRLIAETYDGIWCSVGTHPAYASEEETFSADKILHLTQHPKVIALGETGLDYHWQNNPPREIQKSSFLKHIAVSRESGLPLIVHARSADVDIACILENEMKKGVFPFILHCFASSQDLALKAIELGGYISFSAILGFKKEKDLREIALQLPSDRILLETDSPYLLPRTCRAKYNEPAFMKETATTLSEILGKNLTETASLTTGNFFRLFKKAGEVSLPEKVKI